jgi:hypothetical protein
MQRSGYVIRIFKYCACSAVSIATVHDCVDEQITVGAGLYKNVSLSLRCRKHACQSLAYTAVHVSTATFTLTLMYPNEWCVYYCVCSEEINRRPEEYWSRVMEVARLNSVSRIQRCCAIMGRSESDEMSSAQVHMSTYSY